MKNYKINKSKIAIIGLGYVGLPLAVEFAKKKIVVGFDVNLKRINELKNNFDSSLEISKKKLKNSKNLTFSNIISDIKNCKIFIIAVPTPINLNKEPDLKNLRKSSESIGKIIKKGDLIIYESTVYPGATEEFCVPILEKQSGLIFNKDFYCGYSPERINPGDKKHKINNIKKITSGSTPYIAQKVDNIYKEIIDAGTFKASTIKVAEAAKVIENTQRDVNIGLINELSLIFKRLNIDTEAVLKAASTKWNFVKFVPGLVGGHCIGVDPYYLTYKAMQSGYRPEMTLAGRKINDDMPYIIKNEIIEIMKRKKIKISNSKALVMGLTFKENCPDTRNSGVVNLIYALIKSNIKVDVYDPYVEKNEIKKNFNLNIVDEPIIRKYNLIILAVAHDKFKKLSIKKVKSFGKRNHVLYDIKYLFDRSLVDGRL